MKKYPLGEVSVEQFLADYWQKKPLLIRNALPGITPPLSAEELAGLACEEFIESRLIINQNDCPEQTAWQLKHGPFNEKDFSNLPDTQWTLLVQAVDHFIPEAAELLEQFDFIPRWRIDDLMVSFARMGGGVGAHFDNYDVFLVQVQGQRLWQVGGKYNDQSPLKEHLPVKIVESFHVEHSWTLNPGDILYLPPAVGHNGVAQSNDCMTCSVGFRAPSHTDILREFTDYLGDQLNESIRYHDGQLALQENSGEIHTDVFTQLRSILEEYLHDDSKLQDWFGRYITTPKYELPNYHDQESVNYNDNLQKIKQHLSADSCIYHNENSRFAFIQQSDQHILFVDGERIKTSNHHKQLIECLCKQSKICQQDFTHTKDNLKLICQLLAKEVLYIQ